MKKRKRTSAELFAEVAARYDVPDMPAEAAAVVREVIAGNDRVGRKRRVSAARMLEALKADYDWQHGMHALEGWVKKNIGRKSWAQK